MDFEHSRTKTNLMRAFSGESQARNRYTFAAGLARKEHLEVVARVFEFTAGQELAHAKVFYNLLEPSVSCNVTADGNYPIDLYPDVLSHLKAARHNEFQEWEHDYAEFSRIAAEEGYHAAAETFRRIAEIEKTHGERFDRFAGLLEQGKLFVSEGEELWMCLKCGRIIRAAAAPEQCDVCKHGQDYYVRLTMAPFGG